MRVAVFGRTFPPSAREEITTLFSILQAFHVDVFVHSAFYRYLKDRAELNMDIRGTFTGYEDIPEKTDFLFSVGGDGTFLETVGLVRDRGIPVAGINIGRLGFLAYISRDTLSESVESILNGRYEIEERMLLKVETQKMVLEGLNVALNDVRLYKTGGSLITVHVRADDEFLGSYWADGLLVSTPTGSTAYNLSVGGPIVVPESHSIILSPIAPHNLSVRPMVLPDSAVLKLNVDTRDRGFQLALDSRTKEVGIDTSVTICRAAYTLKMVRIEDISFFSTLRNKLMWGADRRN
ncbi:MAG: NAD kinase [Bacteroidales bacterium]|nr:NAD kinase [Bacteroidales bacterium]MBN2697307.1 NAD kinase [Bacteroidales bacterium]